MGRHSRRPRLTILARLPAGQPHDLLGHADDHVVTVPTALARFMHTFEPEGDPPREWAERLYNIRQWTTLPAGGHFAPVEEPERLARDIVTFFAAL